MEGNKWAVVKIWNGTTTKIGIDEIECTSIGSWVLQFGLTEQEAHIKTEEWAKILGLEVFNNEIDSFYGYSK